MLLSFLIAAAVLIVATFVTVSLKSSTSWGDGRDYVVQNPSSLVLPVVLTTFTFGIWYLTPKVKGLAWGYPLTLLVISVLLTVTLIVWWLKEGASFIEVICFAILAFIFYRLAAPNAAVLADRIYKQHKFWSSVVDYLPMIIFVASLGVFVISALCLNGGSWITLAVIVLIAAILAIMGLGWNWKALGFSKGDEKAEATAKPMVTPKPTAGPAEDSSEESWYGFYNLLLLEDDDPDNDFNFGWNPYTEEKTAKDYDLELRERLKNGDVALAAAEMAWLDVKVGTRYIGKFYDECSREWDAAMNATKVAFMNDQELYYKTLDAFFGYLDSAKSVEITKAKGIKDQMYLNPYTIDGIPDIIVMESPKHEGWFLTYTFVIKETLEVKVSYRIECGFQPCDVSEIMRIPITKKPTPTKTPKPTKKATATPKPTKKVTATPKPTKKVTATPKPTATSTATPKPTVTVTPKPVKTATPKPTATVKPKDPTKGTDVGKNDTTGPGKDTNNGVGSNTSTEDKDTNSNHFQSYDDYKKKMDELKEANEKTKASSTPTVTTKPTATAKPTATPKVDSKESSINVPTPTKEPVHIYTPSTVAPISTSPAGHWDGPAD